MAQTKLQIVKQGFIMRKHKQNNVSMKNKKLHNTSTINETPNSRLSNNPAPSCIVLYCVQSFKRF